jgi:hypothetical protein
MTRPVNRPHKKHGFAPHQPPANAAARIAALAASGHSVVGIARGLNASRHSLERWLDENPELAEALARGREAERLALHNVLYVQATKHHNIVAAMFLLKARHGYREGDQSADANRVSINFTMPGALSPGEFLKAIEHEQPADPDKSLPAPRLSRS